MCIKLLFVQCYTVSRITTIYLTFYYLFIIINVRIWPGRPNMTQFVFSWSNFWFMNKSSAELSFGWTFVHRSYYVQLNFFFQAMTRKSSWTVWPVKEFMRQMFFLYFLEPKLWNKNSKLSKLLKKNNQNLIVKLIVKSIWN